ncbi:glycosyltransferase family 2 protein [Puniceicoccales bacterium CK1056]|uniref:Glycosyltransferase family 2 protein n=1 Tax=Oceanipulchritudo coccoides TaxID=2706888 RepID=A0A6B2M3D9_9BACT|nr:glycosyltransferase family A protein [Oceanipulchritudo coccoides]NDV62325.1 glycosyltransferase family 2 protein [Oceanipulchritudo coccoides]
MSASEISVIIPAFNREGLIGPTLESLLNQTIPAVEILVVDDGSTDQTAQVAASFGPSVRVIHQENQGPSAARNNGLRQSRGEFIHFFDSDDIAVPNKHEVQLKALEAGGADIAYGPWIKGAFSGKTFIPSNGVLQQRGLPAGDLVKSLLCDWSIVPHACLFRRDIVERSGGFPDDLFVGEDQFMFLRCLLAGAKVVHSPDTLELYRADNTDKITESGGGLIKRLVEWARFLIKANHLCRKNRYIPTDWFLFQKRAYNVFSELKELDFQGKQELLSNLSALFVPRKKFFYNVSGFVNQKRQGLEMRLTGNRGSRDFRVGSLTETQITEIQQAGYNIPG